MATSPRRKLVVKRLLSNAPAKEDGRGTPSKSVTFNEDIVETSIGGTSSVSRMKHRPLFSMENVNKLKKERISGQCTSETPEKQNGKENKKYSNSERKSETTDSIKRVEGFSSRRPHASLEVQPEKSPFKTPPMKSRRHTLESKLFETPDCYRLVDLETPQKYDANYDSEYSSSTEDGEDSCDSVTVAVRVRPFSQRELADPNVKCVVNMNGNETTVTNDSGTVHRFAYDLSFWSHDQNSDDGDDKYSGQETVYNQLAQPLLGKAFDGYNTCLFAYGQTGSGKSYSMMGHGEETGIIPRFCEELFAQVDLLKNKEMVKINVEISFFEIYNEKIHDLLASVKEKSAKKPSLKVREHPVLGPYVEGLSTYVVNSFEDVEGWIFLGNKNRATASTGMNDKSSRSHSVFTIVLTQSKTERIEGTDHEHCTNSKINLVDLAGSERQSQAQTTGERLREGANINKSLMALGKVISLLSEQSLANKKRKIFIPYRDSVLTWLLKESLGGNSKTAMIATISPANHHVEETLSTLRYAKQARSIVNVVRVNEDPKAKLIRELRAEIEKLKQDTNSTNDGIQQGDGSLEEIMILRDKLTAKEQELGDITRSWQERLERSEERKAEEARLLQKSGVAFKVDNQLPNLVNLNEDPQLAELLLYVIKEGQTRVGRMSPTLHHDIQLNGALIADNHCIINNVDGVVSITPIGDAPNYVNGNMISEPSILHHGDRLVLGGDHYFRFNHPIEVKQNTKKGKGVTVVKDFEFARQELIAAQDARLQAELDEARKEAEAEMQQELEKAKQEAELILKSQQSNFEDKLADLEKALQEQNIESKKALQSQQETEDLVNKLKQQKTLLEQEMLESKKKQQLETEAQHKAMKSYRESPLLALLESDRKKAEEKLTELKIQRAEAKSPFRLAKTPDKMDGKRDLYKVALLLREANKISQFLKKKITFSREDVLEDNVVIPLIKVTNGNHNMCTSWSVRKLENKIIQMRELYQNDSSTDEEDVFNDPEDNWEKDSFISSPTCFNSPNSSGYQKSPLPTSGKRRVSLQSNSSFSSLRRVSGSFSGMKPENDVSVFKVCKDLISTLTESFNDINFEESIGDKVLLNCQALKQIISSIIDYSNTSAKGSDELSIRRQCVQLVSALQLLASNCTVWATLVEGKEAQLLRDLVISMSSQVKIIGKHAAMLLQGHENELDSLVQESGCKAVDSIYTVCKLCGELALASNNKMIQLQQLTAGQTNQLGHDICQYFINGSDVYVDRTLQNGIKTLEDCEMKAQIYSDETSPNMNIGHLAQNIEIAMSAIKILLQKCQEIQVEVDTSMRESSDNRPFQLYHLNYTRSHTLVAQVQNMTQSAIILLQSTGPLLKGVNKDWRKVVVCSEMIQKCSSKLLTSSGKESSKRDSSDSSDSDISVLSDTQMEQLEYAAEEVKSSMTTLMNQTQKYSLSNVGTPSRNGGTPSRNSGTPGPIKDTHITLNH